MSTNSGLFLPETQQITEENMTESMNNTASVVNLKESGIYDKVEYVCGKTYFPTADSTSGRGLTMRPVYRKVIDFGTLPNTATTNVAHGITINTGFTITELYGAATDPVGKNYIQLPYSSPTPNQNISLSMDGTNVIVTTGIDMTAYTTCRIVIEFLRS